MAELRCPSCGREFAAGQEFCDGDFVQLVPTGAPAREDVPDPDRVPEPVRGAGSAACPTCGGEATAGATECDYCGSPVVTPTSVTPAVPARAPSTTDGPVRLRGPWGALDLGADRLEIGRTSPVGRIADALADVDIVSRRHAEVVHTDGTVWLVDVGSANGTYVNDRRLAAGTPVVVRPGDAIRLGSSVHLELLVEPGGHA